MRGHKLISKLEGPAIPSVLLIMCFCLNNLTIARTPNHFFWTERDNSGHQWQSGRHSHGMAYLGDDKVLLFGGMDQGRLQDTYIYDLSQNTWSWVNPSTKPDNRMDFGMAHIGGDRVLLFGGNRAHGTWLDDTWVYDYSENGWTELSPGTAPSRRRSLAMSYIGDDKVLLFGGYAGSAIVSENSDETWLYDLSDNNWTLMNPATKPAKRNSHSMAYIGGDKVVLFGGTDQGALQDTWIYDLSENDWVQKNPSSKPDGRINHDMVYIGGGQVALYGGVVPVGGGVFDDTWVYNLGDDSWTEHSKAHNPGYRWMHGFSETSMNGSSTPVLFGGASDTGGPSDDPETWVLDGTYCWTVQIFDWTWRFCLAEAPMILVIPLLIIAAVGGTILFARRRRSR